MGGTGLERSDVSAADDKHLQKPPPEGGAESGAVGAKTGLNDPDAADLRRVAEAWPALPEPVKARILAMVAAAQGGR